jgi:two-component sensor histidine kinase
VVQEGAFTWRRRAIPLLDRQVKPLWRRVVRPDEAGGVVLLTVHDVTDNAQRERELRIKSAMIQEIHHRVKNNLQTIAALLRIQARRTGSPDVGTILQETIDRILSISYVHDLLARQESNQVDLREVAQQIISEVSQGILDPITKVRFTLDAPGIHLPAQQATSCALVINELLHNTVEHGFSGASEGSVFVRLTVDSVQITLEVVDDGKGLPASFDLRTSGSLGLQIVQTLVRDDLKGTFGLASVDGHGTQATVRFPRIG